MFNIDLAWKEFNVSVPAVQSAVTLLITSTPIFGISCDNDLTIHCESEPTVEELDAVVSYWEALTLESIEATSYKTQAQIAEEADIARNLALESAKTKLSALGLSLDEIKAIIGA